MSLVIDVQGFKRERNKFVVKELAAYDGKRIAHFVFKPPFPFEMLSLDLQNHANWLTKNAHGLQWKSGSTPHHVLDRVLEDLTQSAERVYCQGKEKAAILQQFMSMPVIEFPDNPTLEKRPPNCFCHSIDACMCALANVLFLYETFVMH